MGNMTTTTRKLLEGVAFWPDEDIEKLAHAANQIEAWHDDEYHMRTERAA